MELQERPGTESGRSGEHLGSLGPGWLEHKGAGTTNASKGPRVKSLVPGWTSLAVQWLRLRLPVQGSQVQSLVQKDPTCRRATKSRGHDY